MMWERDNHGRHGVPFPTWDYDFDGRSFAEGRLVVGEIFEDLEKRDMRGMDIF